MINISVSVIVPIYNVEPWLKECLDSLESQTLKNIEVILVNDGSTDNSKAIAEIYVKRNDNFILINQRNGGLSAARNTGLKKAQGEYVYFLDSDDFLINNALETLYNKAKTENLDVLKFVAYTFTEPSRKMEWSLNGYKYKGEYSGVYRGIDILQKFIDNDDTSYPSSCLIFTKRSVIEKYYLRFFEGIIHEDNLFHFQLLSLCERVTVLNKPLYCRRYRAGSITQSNDYIKANKSMCISAEELDKFIEKYPHIIGKTSSWYVNFYIHMMIANWHKMPIDLQNSRESKEYFQRIKFLTQKYSFQGKKADMLLVNNIELYQFMRKIKRTIKNIIGR